MGLGDVGLGRFIISAGWLALTIGAAGAETRALVVGVSGYPNLAKSIRLVGPKNDSREMANTLARLGVPASNITVLADGVTGLSDGIGNPGPGDKQSILLGLDRLAETSKSGDLVVFYFSGHGSQQPDINGDEEGGADEIFLPYDVGSWSADGVKNALVDDELNVRVERILEKGVDFFGVIDACHSATGFRDLPGDDVRSRAVDPKQLGVPEFAEEDSARGLIATANEAKAAGRGRAAFFYAAQENEEALEKTPKDSENGESYAVFTYELLRRMNQTPGLTYRTLHQAVVADIKRNTLMTTQTPEVEGDLLDEPVLRLTGAQARRQWPIFNGKLQAGALQGLSNGSLVALYADAAATDDLPVAYGTIDAAGATRSIVSLAPAPCDDASACAAPDEAAFKKGRFARLVKTGIDLGLVLSEPIRIDAADGKDYANVVAALRAAVGGLLGARISMRPAGYDIAVGLVDGTLAFSPAGGSIDRNGPGSSPRLTLPADATLAAARIEEAVDRIAKATALQRLGGGSDGARSLGLNSQVLVAASKTRPDAGEACSDNESDYAPAAPVGDNPSLSDCDVLSIVMANGGRKPLDVTVLLIGADFAITPVWPVEGQSNRILASESKSVDLLQMEPNPKSSAEERLVFLAVPGVNRSHTAFTDLGQEGLRAAPGEDEPEIARVRELFATGLNDMSRGVVTPSARVDEEMSIDIKSFFVSKGTGG